MDSPQVDHNTEKWTAFCKNDDHAEEILKNQCLLLSCKKLIVSAKKQLVESKKSCHGLLIYKFTIITRPKDS